MSAPHSFATGSRSQLEGTLVPLLRYRWVTARPHEDDEEGPALWRRPFKDLGICWNSGVLRAHERVAQCQQDDAGADERGDRDPTSDQGDN